MSLLEQYNIIMAEVTKLNDKNWKLQATSTDGTIITGYGKVIEGVYDESISITGTETIINPTISQLEKFFSEDAH